MRAQDTLEIAYNHYSLLNSIHNRIFGCKYLFVIAIHFKTVIGTYL